MYWLWRSRRAKRGSQTPPAAGRFQYKPHLEALEDRLVLSAPGTSAVGPHAPPLDHVAAVAITAIAGEPFTGVVATFNTPDVTGLASTIEWGDGRDGTGIITGSGNQTFQISGAHAFAQPGSYTMLITITAGQGPESEVQATATVLAPPTNVMALVIPAGQVSVQISFGLTADFATATVYLITTPAVASALPSDSQFLGTVWRVFVAATPPGNTTPPTPSIQIQITGPMPSGSTDYVPWSSMREQGLALPLVPSAAPAKLIAGGYLPQGDLASAGAAFARDQSGITRITVPSWLSTTALTLVMVFDIPNPPDTRNVTQHEPNGALAAASIPADETGLDQTAHGQEVGRDSYRLPLHLVADRAELRGLSGVSFIGTTPAPLAGGSANPPAGTAPDGSINNSGRAGTSETAARMQTSVRDEDKPYSGRWSITVGAMVQATMVWVAIHFSFSSRAKSPTAPSIVKEP